MIIENTAKIKLDVFNYNSFEFTERHLEQNREALEVRSQPSSSLQATPGSSQDGSGQLDPTFVSRIASLVQAEITKNKFNETKTVKTSTDHSEQSIKTNSIVNTEIKKNKKIKKIKKK